MSLGPVNSGSVNPGDATRVCVLTPSGRGAVAVVAVEGVEAATITDRFFQAANGRPVGEQALGRIVYGFWGSSEGEDLVVCRRSKTSLEIHCHGGRQSSAQIVADLSTVGGTVIEVEAWLGDRGTNAIAAAAQLALTQTATLRTATVLLDQYHGALQQELEMLLAELADEKNSAATTRIENLLLYASLGKHLTEPWQVVIAGRPNVGKSSLINALIGYERAIVFDQPGTTRDVVSSTTAIDGWPIEFSDTAGLHDSTDAIETAGITLARQRLVAADLVVWVLDATELTGNTNQSPEECALEQSTAVGVKLGEQKKLLVINKIDLAQTVPAAVSANSPAAFPNSSTKLALTCAVTGTGIQSLLTSITAQLLSAVPPSHAAVPFTAEQTNALEASLTALGQSDPHTATIQVQSLLL